MSEDEYSDGGVVDEDDDDETIVRRPKKPPLDDSYAEEDDDSSSDGEDGDGEDGDGDEDDIHGGAPSDDDDDIEIEGDIEPTAAAATTAAAPAAKTKGKKRKPTAAAAAAVRDDGDGDDASDDDDDDNEYLKKFNEQTLRNYIVNYHPECLQNNYDEISKVSVAIRNASGHIIDDLHRTLPIMTRYERARVLGQRAKQIEHGATPFVKVPENVIDCHLIAETELREKKIPFIIKRPIPGGGFEYWKLQDLEVLI